MGNDVIIVDNICYKDILHNVRFVIRKGDKIALIGNNEIAKTTLLNILSGNLKPDSGEIKVGTTVKISYYEKNHDKYFDKKIDMMEWLRQFSDSTDDTFIRGFLGRMLFSGEEALKKVSVLSGGEKVRCVLSKMMLSGANALLLDEPTNHLDMESITALNEGMNRFKGNMIFTSHDHQLTQTVANRILDIKETGLVDREVTYNEYLGLE